MRSVSGRCAGKWFNASGDIFFSELHRDRLSEAIAADHTALQLLEAKNSGNKKQRRLLQNRQSASNVALLRGRRGLSLEFGEFPVNFQNIVLSKLSGKVQMAATLANPVVSGGLTFSDGFISLGNAAGVPRGALGARTKNAMVRKVPPTADMSLKDENHLRGREKSETDENINLEASTELTTQDKLLPNGDASILLSGLRINIGRGMKVIQPLVLNLDTTGTLVLEGSPQAPQIEGEIRLLRGRVNLLATRMSIRKDAKNYVRFVKSDETSPSTAEDSPEPLINATLESERLLVRIPECRLSKWAEHLEVTDRSGDQMSGATWDALVQSELKELRNPEAAARLFAKYAFQAVEAGGKAGKFEWRVFPALVKKNDGKSGKLKDEIGAGAEVEVGGLAIGGKRSVDGTVGGKVRLRLRDWLSWEVEQEGAANTRTIKLEVDLTPKRWNENIGGDREADASNTNEGQSDRQKRKDKKGTTRLQGDTGPDKEESKKEGAGAENTHKGPSETKVVTEGTSTAEKERVEDTKLGLNDASEGVTSKDEKTIDSENASKGSGK
ncbi:unnamed protein product [Chondrus crispus]|uniref:Translocation and assembly module TamB C-terminal domain-containing protein n=1 Tax=Chondrus crispus TaxID=2769 RepID=R7Q8S2_CHOCR|nr:unnamed protein product [Chondrus crispus]CDF33791.1 unnamed protein product [Chondrus crispus]|eukprot:XP_005713610.1 unnamed protein product [Chondrus crispus]